MALRAFKFTFKGLALGGEAVIIAESFSQAIEMCRSVQVYDDVPVCEDESGTPLTKPQILHAWNGDY